MYPSRKKKSLKVIGQKPFTNQIFFLLPVSNRPPVGMRSDIRDGSLLSLLMNQTKLLPKAVGVWKQKHLLCRSPFYWMSKKISANFFHKNTATGAASTLISLASARLAVPSSLWLSADVATSVILGSGLKRNSYRCFARFGQSSLVRGA